MGRFFKRGYLFEFYYGVEVLSWRWIVSQALLAALIVGIIVGWQQKDKVKLMTWQVGFNFLSAIANIFLLNWIAVAIGAVGGVRQLAFIYVELRRRKRMALEAGQEANEVHTQEQVDAANKKAKQKEFLFGLSVFLFFTAVNIVTIYFTMQNYYGFVIMAARIAVNFVMWKGNVHAIKIVAALVWSSIMIVNQLMFFSFIGMAKEVITIGSVVVFYIRFFHNKKVERRKISI